MRRVFIDLTNKKARTYLHKVSEQFRPPQPAAKVVGALAYFIRQFLASEYFVSHHCKEPKYALGTRKYYTQVLERMRSLALPIGSV